ncbi:Hypothetical predicted protein [Xyrichtys novacula]|uniref:Uncharacterized protein n=1 Tax=Xyrichtys novacula TaxID=13765 RepID=A0AAV1FZL5_XYRNO|nr:Hypothetical predicted protein [Xyrichtys novacula]
MLEAEKLAFEQKIKDLQEDVSRRAEELTNNTKKTQKLQDLVKSSKTQLQAEKNRVENLKKEGKDLRSELQIANDTLTQFYKLEAETLAQKQETEAEREERKRKEDSVKAKKVEALQQLVELFKTKLQAEKNRTKTLQSEQEEIRSSLQEIANQNLKQANQSEAEKLVLEQTVRELQEEIISRAKTETIYLTKIQEDLDMVASQNILLQEKGQMADDLMTQLEEVRHQLLDKNSEELNLIEEVTTENKSLKQKVSDLQREAQSREKFYEDQLETLNSQLKEANSTWFQLASDLEDTKEICQALRKDLIELQKIPEVTEETPEMKEVSKTTPETIKATPSIKISWWRRVKKRMTPKHLCQYKQWM